ncbi:MAG: class B sortase [Eggerthellaceae bacterium]|nr:class B sortase [Eggerthellaceae bacterium]
MADRNRTEKNKKVRKGGKLLPALCNVFGTLLILAVIGLCLPLTVPKLMGYDVFNVVSGSMEPEIPVGSAVFVKPATLGEVQEGEVIAYQDGESVIVHRVVTNRTSLGEFVTKGDANNTEDLSPIPYEAVIGRMEAHIPQFGAFMSIYASTMGKVYLLLTAACGVMFNILAARMRESRRQQDEQVQHNAEIVEEALLQGGALGEGAAFSSGANAYGSQGYGAQSAPLSQDRRPAKEKRPRNKALSVLRGVLVCVLATAFLGSAGVIGYVTWQYSISDALYNDAVDKYANENGSATMAPIEIDFKELRAKNPDVVGWIYCPGTVINYPVLQGKDNDKYLGHDYTGEYNINGSIFVDADNAPGFVDGNTIIYGHHMNSGSMFAGLIKWADQEYYEDHPVMWLLTPTQDYKIDLFSGHHISAHSSMYDIIHEHGEKLIELLKEARDLSDFMPTNVIELDAKSSYVMLSTCAYLFDNDRYVLHGKLVPVNSAGGKAK